MHVLTLMDEALGDVAFLARSENRVAILRALGTRSRTRRELEDETGVSRSTLGRALGDLEERRWVERDGQTYATTTAGDLILDQFVPLLETMGGLRTLEDAVDLLPIEEMSLDIRHLADAQVVTPTELNPTAPYDYHIETLQDADNVYATARTGPPSCVTALHEMVTSGHLDATLVLDRTYLGALSADEEMMRQWCEMAAGSATIQSHEGPIPYVLFVLDETIQLWPCDDTGITWGVVESEDSRVLSWARATIEDYRNQARPLETVLET